MARFHALFVYTLARKNLRDIAQITERMHGFDDLVNQTRRADTCPYTNIGEGTSSGNDR